MNPYCRLAKSAIETYIKTGKVISPPVDLPEKLLTEKAAVFVSLHQENNGRLRGCIGTFLPTKKNIAEEIISNAVAAATQDPRFPPVTEKELGKLEVSVDILSKPKLVPGTYAPNPKKYGLVVSTADGRRGLLLPDIPGVETVRQQIQICRQKGGISPKEPVRLEIFTVRRYLL